MQRSIIVMLLCAVMWSGNFAQAQQDTNRRKTEKQQKKNQKSKRDSSKRKRDTTRMDTTRRPPVSPMR